jgi:hypothetical protein
MDEPGVVSEGAAETIISSFLYVFFMKQLLTPPPEMVYAMPHLSGGGP